MIRTLGEVVGLEINWDFSLILSIVFFTIDLELAFVWSTTIDGVGPLFKLWGLKVTESFSVVQYKEY